MFRFTNLDSKFYWHDEVINSFWVSGYNVPEAISEIAQQKKINIEQLKKYQYPNTDKSLFSPVIELANNEPQNPPLYYLLSWTWLKIMGNSIVITRSLSVIISILVFPAIYYLCKILFHSNNISYIAVSLLAISPFNLIYAQEARPYSLWCLTVILSSITLLKAISTGKDWHWFLYFISLVCSFYTFPFSLFVACGHSIYFLTVSKFQKKHYVAKFITSSLLALVAFAPWLIFIQINAYKISDWREDPISLVSLVQSWVGNISRIFCDFNLDATAPLIYIIPTTVSLFLLVIYSIYYLCRYEEKNVWMFVILLVASTAVALGLPDLIIGGQRSRIARYLTPSYLGLLLVVAYYLASEFSARQLWRKYLSKIIFSLLIITGIASCSIYLQADNWWHKSWTKLLNYDQLITATTAVNRHPNTLIIAPDIKDINEDIFFEILSFTHLMNSQVSWQFGLEEAEKIVNQTQENKFIYDPLETSVDHFPKTQLQPITKNFWQLQDF